MFKSIPAKVLSMDIYNEGLKGETNNIILGGVTIPNEVLKKNILMTGACGTGKTTAIKSIITQVRARGERAIIFDMKGDYTKEYLTDGDITFDKFINVQEWLNNWTGFLFVTNDVQVAEVTNQLLSLPDDNNRVVWFIFDGFDTLPEIPVVLYLSKFGRSKGAQCVFAIQSIENLSKMYNKDAAIQIVVHSSTNIIFRTHFADAEFFSEFLGQVSTSHINGKIFTNKLVVSHEIATQKQLHFIASVQGFGTAMSHLNL